MDSAGFLCLVWGLKKKKKPSWWSACHLWAQHCTPETSILCAHKFSPIYSGESSSPLLLVGSSRQIRVDPRWEISHRARRLGFAACHTGAKSCTHTLRPHWLPTCPAPGFLRFPDVLWAWVSLICNCVTSSASPKGQGPPLTSLGIAWLRRGGCRRTLGSQVLAFFGTLCVISWTNKGLTLWRGSWQAVVLIPFHSLEKDSFIWIIVLWKIDPGNPQPDCSDKTL